VEFPRSVFFSTACQQQWQSIAIQPCIPENPGLTFVSVPMIVVARVRVCVHPLPVQILGAIPPVGARQARDATNLATTDTAGEVMFMRTSTLTNQAFKHLSNANRAYLTLRQHYNDFLYAGGE
jgi:hypothetical protein